MWAVPIGIVMNWGWWKMVGCFVFIFPNGHFFSFFSFWVYYHIYSYKVFVKSRKASVDIFNSTSKNHTFIVLSCICVHVHKCWTWNLLTLLLHWVMEGEEENHSQSSKNLVVPKKESPLWLYLNCPGSLSASRFTDPVLVDLEISTCLFSCIKGQQSRSWMWRGTAMLHLPTWKD